MYYLHNHTLLSILSALTCLIFLTIPYAFLHQSWHNQTRPFTPLRNDGNPILTFNTNPLTLSRTHPPITIQIIWVEYFLFPFRIFLLITQIKKGPLVFLFDPYLHKYIYDLQKSALYVTSFMTSTFKIYKPQLPDYKNPRILCYPMSTVNTPNKQHTCLLPIIHQMLSITLHMSKHHPIKNYHNSLLSYEKDSFITLCLRGANPNLPLSPQQHGRIHGGENMILKHGPRSQFVLP